MCVTDILLMAGAPAGELVDIARPALAAADTWGLHQWDDAILRYNVAEALIAQGDPQGPGTLSLPIRRATPSRNAGHSTSSRAVLELLRGRSEEAHRHITAVGEGPSPKVGLTFRLGYNATAATIELWSGHPADALERALPVLVSGEETEEPAILASLLVLAARAAADLRDRASGQQLRDLHRRLAGDPFARHPSSSPHRPGVPRGQPSSPGWKERRPSTAGSRPQLPGTASLAPTTPGTAAGVGRRWRWQPPRARWRPGC